ncbi:TonB-dependent receptor plug domain-containing protein [Luteimonas granuli]|uniref:TonB-dependent receptor n=1 Tax=Luteimonas granuli TaxID=1176533 RepID=A0A518N6P1_9GAMM|nr:TonB-dependent receptor [Luteimonas granuli]QDW67579.1 TonB-dependent receptor [Luteimonas granuli]
MKTRNRRTALSIALLAVIAGASGAALAQAPAPAEAPPVDEAVVDDPEEAPEATELASITVTGTRIRGGEAPSPVITIGSERIREEGLADLGEVIRSVPQNFNGGQNPGVSSGGLSGAGFANANVTGGSSLNLRGLGPDATLTLLNGRRMAYSGFVQAVDIGAIPVEAVDRVEIAADGASAIYGSDAVGGVGNVILKRDFDGVALGARYGAATDGGLATREYSATAGTYWNSGGLIASYKDVSVDPIHASKRHYSDHLGPPTTIYPGSDLRSGLFSGYQRLGEAVELRVDALGSRRDQLYFFDFMGINRLAPETTTSLVSPGVEFLLPQDWTLSLGGTWAKSDHDEYQTRTVPATGGSVLVADECFCNESRTWELGGEGPLIPLAAGDVRLALGAGYRRNEFWRRNGTNPLLSVQGDESARFAYAEVDVPLIGADSAASGTRRLSLTAALRREDYSRFGGVTTPKVGMIFSPVGSFTAKASWGRSFKAPTLLQVHQGQVSQLAFPRAFGGPADSGDDMVIRIGGGNPDLKPERAETWTASFGFHPESVPGLEMELAAFHVDYVDRVVQPIINYSQVLNDPTAARLVDRQPSAAELERIISTTRFFNATGRSYDPDNVVAVIHGEYVNVARQKIKGVDLSASQRFELDSGRLTARGSVAWIDSVQQATTAHEFLDLSGTLFHPAKLSGRLGMVWERGNLTSSAFANHIGGVTNPVDGKKSASFTTLDATLRYASDRSVGAWSGVVLALSAQNLLDRAPPLYTTTGTAIYSAPFDSTNYSAIGRFLSLSVSRHF